jgi:tetrapyrrole methylase family protein/MazG family protein
MAAFAIDPAEDVQLIAAPQLLARAAQLAGAPTAVSEEKDQPYSVMQGFGAYRPPLLPYPLQPSSHVLVWGTPAEIDLPALAAIFAQRYPPGHAVRIVALSAGAVAAPIVETTISALALQDPTPNTQHPVLYLPPLLPAANLRGLDGLAWVVARLYGPAGCPWDRQQTHSSLRGALLEETHEVLEAIDAGDLAGLSEELGDLLLAVVAQSEMARQGGGFALEDVLAGVAAKLIGRHPHVFGDLEVSGTGEVLHNWEQIKAQELAAKGRSRASALDGIPPTLPALATAHALAKKAVRAGFSWGAIDGAWDKFGEELAELRAAAVGDDPAHTAEELGDLLFTLAVLARWLKIDPEIALRDANAKFRRRFSAIEQAAGGRPLSELGLDALLELWAAAKSS